MRLEVLVDHGEPEVYPLNKNEIVLGSGEGCDIIVNAAGVSRKHLKIYIDGDNFYISDQGSTNGSFLNEERLVPGKRVEFTSFFPVRLGDSVLLTLLSDEETSESELKSFAEKLIKSVDSTNRDTSDSFSEATRVIKFNDVKKVKTQELVDKRQKKIQSKASTKVSKKKVDKNPMTVWYLLSALILGGAVYYQFFLNDSPVASSKPVNNLEQAEVQKIPNPSIQTTPLLLSEEELLSEADIRRYLGFIKCTEPVELHFCEKLDDKKFGEEFGVYQKENNLLVFVSSSIWMGNGLRIFPKNLIDYKLIYSNFVTKPEHDKLIEENIKAGKLPPSKKQAQVLGLMEFLRRNNYLNDYPNHHVYMIFLNQVETSFKIDGVVAIRNTSIPQLRSVNDKSFRSSLSVQGAKSLSRVERYFNIFKEF